MQMGFVQARNVWEGGNHCQTTERNFTANILSRKLVHSPNIQMTRSDCCRGDQPYLPPTKPYELSNLASDLVLFARYLLKPGGRLVFFLPTVTDEYEEVDIMAMLCDGMEVIANSLQNFGSWGRRVGCVFYSCFQMRFNHSFLKLVTIKKTTNNKYPPPAFEARQSTNHEEEHTPAHRDFREKYFQGFKKADECKDDQLTSS